jgi:hypothetical protein
MVRSPKSLAVTLAGSKFVGHIVVLTCKFVGENRSRPNREETSVQEMDAYAAPIEVSVHFLHAGQV